MTLPSVEVSLELGSFNAPAGILVVNSAVCLTHITMILGSTCWGLEGSGMNQSR
jgi:hypothetical protein